MPTKEVLKDVLKRGESLQNILYLREGQGCTIFKTDVFFPTDIIVYIPDMEMNFIPYRSFNLSVREIDHIIENCYSGKDFIEITGGDETKAKILFHYVDWQHPSSAYDAGEINDDDDDDNDGKEETKLNNVEPIGIVYTVVHPTYTGTQVSWPVAVVTDLSKAKEVKEQVIQKYGECETYYFHLNSLEPVTEEEVNQLKL